MNNHNTCNSPLALCDKSSKDKFWLDDPFVLYKNDNYTKIIPKYEMTKNEQLNSITRFCIYMIIIILMFNRGEYILILPITCLIIVILFKKFNNTDLFGRNKGLSKILNIRENKKEQYNINENKQYSQDDTLKLKTSDEMDEQENQRNYTIKSGSYDAYNKLNIGFSENNAKMLEHSKKDMNSLYTIDEVIDYNKNTCRKPTFNNPMMNPSVLDFGVDNSPVACNSDDDNIKETIKINFNRDLFRDVDELWEKANSQRQFYTMPNTAIPNNQTEFGKWCFTGGEPCKSNQEGCFRYDDIRSRSR